MRIFFGELFLLAAVLLFTYVGLYLHFLIFGILAALISVIMGTGLIGWQIFDWIRMAIFYKGFK